MTMLNGFSQTNTGSATLLDARTFIELFFFFKVCVYVGFSKIKMQRKQLVIAYKFTLTKSLLKMPNLSFKSKIVES